MFNILNIKKNREIKSFISDVSLIFLLSNSEKREVKYLLDFLFHSINYLYFSNDENKEKKIKKMICLFFLGIDSEQAPYIEKFILEVIRKYSKNYKKIRFLNEFYNENNISYINNKFNDKINKFLFKYF